MLKLLGGGKTIKPVHKIAKDTDRYSLHKSIQASLGSSIDMFEAVKLPEKEKKEEWITVHCIDFYNVINLICGAVIPQYCTCEEMTCGKDCAFLWKDKNDTKYKNPTAVTAKQYIDFALDYIDNKLKDEKIFPASSKTPFPKNFTKIVKTIFKYIFRIFAHLVKDHFKDIQALGLLAHVNTSLKHFLCFGLEFDLFEKRDLEYMLDYINFHLGDKYSAKLPKKNSFRVQ